MGSCRWDNFIRMFKDFCFIIHCITSKYFFEFELRFYGPVTHYGHVEPVYLTTVFLGRLSLLSS